MSIFEYLNPGENCANIRPEAVWQMSLKTFIVPTLTMREMCSGCKERTSPKAQATRWIFHCAWSSELRGGFSEIHLARLYGVAQSTVSWIFVPWINYMNLKFGKICIWPSEEVVQATMPADFKEKFPTMTVWRCAVRCPAVCCSILSYSAPIKIM